MEVQDSGEIVVGQTAGDMEDYDDGFVEPSDVLKFFGRHGLKDRLEDWTEVLNGLENVGLIYPTHPPRVVFELESDIRKPSYLKRAHLVPDYGSPEFARTVKRLLEEKADKLVNQLNENVDSIRQLMPIDPAESEQIKGNQYFLLPGYFS